MNTPTALRFLPGVGPKRADQLAAIGLHDVVDLLHHAPRCLAAVPDEVGAADLPKGGRAQIRGRVTRVTAVPFGRRRALSVRLADAAGAPFVARFFNAGYLRDRFVPGEWFLLEGATDKRQKATLNHPSFTHLAAGDDDPTDPRDGCAVAYPLPDGIGAKAFGDLVTHALDHHLAHLSDPAGQLSDDDYHQRIHQLHRPADPEQHEAARQVLAVREALALAWWLRARRDAVVGEPGRAWAWGPKVHQHALARLPFALTAGQTAALDEIRADLQAPQPMYRLLQGDVGSGKTALALLAALAVIADGAQVLLLAPTAVLARQHHDFMAACLRGSRVALDLLTGGSPPAERGRILDRLAEGSLDLLIGTHALLEDAVRCRELGLCVIDEQHKFGVEQRARLLASAGGQGYQSDLLVLTATPIPRTLTLTLFGDLAVSTIAGKPPGRGRVATELAPWSLRELRAAIAADLEAGGSAFVVTPLRESSDKVAAVDAATLTTQLEESFAAVGVGLVHGALDEGAKLAALERFRRGEIRVLVATTVIEVGVDLPDATLMAVCDAERFGLAQLHQLRGRIGRGARDGRCLLLHRGTEGVERLRILTRTDDGLTVAEADLAARGPGELLGRRQHGIGRFRYLELERDADLIQAAHQAVRGADGTMPPGLARFAPDADGGLLAGA